MLVRSLMLALAALLSTAAIAAEQINVNYQYDGNHRADLSRMRGTLRVAEFTDGRGLADGRLIVDSDPAGGDGYLAEMEMTALVRTALIQGFEHGNARLVESGEDFSVEGSVNSIESEIIDGEIRLTMRVNLQLNRGGRSIWQTNLFGRGLAEDIGGATHAALTRLIRELMNDDYFLIELQ